MVTFGYGPENIPSGFEPGFEHQSAVVAEAREAPETGRGSTAHALAQTNETDEASSCPKQDMYVFCKAEPNKPCICVTLE